jgi:hypothetical protein
MSKRLPKFRSEAAEARFWETHDATEFLEDLSEDTETVFVRPETGVVELRRGTWRRLTHLARQRRTTPVRLLQRWIDEKLRRKPAARRVHGVRRAQVARGMHAAQ